MTTKVYHVKRGLPQELFLVKLDHMGKRLPKMIVTPLKKPPKVLIVGQKDILTTQILKVLENRECQVFLREKLTSLPSHIDYIFQFGKFTKARELLEKAAQDNARYLLIEEKISPKESQEVYPERSRRAEEEVFAFKERVDCRILRIGPVSFSNAPAIANQILKAMFGRKRPLPPPLKFKEKKGKKKKIRLPYSKFKTGAFLFAFFLALFFLLSPHLFFGINFFSGVKNLQSFEKNFLKGDLVNAQENASLAQKFFNQAEKASGLLPPFKKGREAAFFGETLSQIGVSSVSISKIGQKIARLVLGQDEGMIEERLIQLKVEVESLERQISLTEVLYHDLDLENYTLPFGSWNLLDSQSVDAFSLGQKLKKIPLLLSSAKELCFLAKKALPLINEVLGLKEEKIYLVLFQNNMELRPGGGFIGSYGLAYFKGGVLTKLETHDVYTADGQLKGHVEPPAPIKKYLDQPHFFLRDSNFWPDFAINAQRAAWFFKKELGQEVDGVIAVDLSLVQKLLEGLGGVYLPDYKQEITSENLFLKAESFAQSGFFPGSTQKRDFLGALTRGILNQAKVGNGLPWLKVGKGLKEALEEKHIQIFLFDKGTQKLVEEMGWGGRVSVINCQSSMINCFPDYLMVVEANLGVNKANYFVKRDVSLETNFDQEKISHKLSISYQNTSPGETFPGGVYKNYLRVFVPKEAVLKKVEVKGKNLPSKEVEIEEEGDKKSWGVLVQISSGEKEKVVISFDLISNEISSYELFFQKQAGTEKDPLFLRFNYPKTWRVKKTNFPAAIQNGSLTYTSDLSVDRIFSVEFSIL